MAGPANGPPIARLRGVAKRFDHGASGSAGEAGTLALRGLDLEVSAGEWLSLVGPSGCGKSTALRLIAGLLRESAGSVERAADPRDPAAAREAERDAARGDVGFVFQEPTLLPWATVEANIALPLELLARSRPFSVRVGRIGHRRRGRDAIRATVAELIERVGLRGFERARPRELSGGMKMRVSIARALATEPRLLLLDEPFAAVDEITRARLDDDLLALWRGGGLTVVFVTHSVWEAAYLSTRIAVFSPRPGRIVGEVAVETQGERDTPAAARTRQAVAALLAAGMAAGEAETAAGEAGMGSGEAGIASSEATGEAGEARA